MLADRRLRGKQRKEEKPPEDPVTAQLVFHGQPLCAPLQQIPTDVPILHFNLAAPDFLSEYIRVILLTLIRAKAIGPATLLGKPITPMPNPCNRPKPYPEGEWNFKDGNSHYIIELRYTEEREDGTFERGFDGMKVRILFCDYNGYQVGFSRYLDGKWSVWYYISKSQFPLPFFFMQGAIKLPFGGDYTLKYRRICNFPRHFLSIWDFPREKNIQDLEKMYLASAVVFCEVRRIVWIFLEVRRRIQRNQVPRPLDCNLSGRELPEGLAWREITDWSNDCDAALVAVHIGEYGARTKDKGYAHTARPLIMKFRDLVSEDEDSGHLCLLMRNDQVLAPVGGELREKLKKKGLKLGPKVRDPGFPLDPEPPEDRMP